MKEAWLDRSSEYRRTISHLLHIFIFSYSILSFNSVALRCEIGPVLYSLPLLTHTHSYVYIVLTGYEPQHSTMYRW